jgi:MFS family permease
MAFEYIAVATAMPTVAMALNGLQLYALAFGAPMAAAVVGTVAAGRWSDTHDPNAPLWCGLGLFLAGLLLAGLASSMSVLVLGRMLQGFGSGVFSVALYVVVARAYPSELHPRIFAAFAAAWVLPSILGPAVAGLLVELLSWRWVFLLPALLAVPCALLMLPGLKGLERTPAAGARPRIGWALIAAGGTVALHMTAQWHGAAAALLLLLALASVLIAAARLLPLGTLGLARGLPTVVALRGLAASAFFGAEVFVPLMMTTERGLSPAWAGSALTIGALGWSAGSWYEGRHSTDVPARARVLREGLLLMVVGIASQALLLLPEVPLAVGIVAWGVTGLGMGRTYPVLSVLTLELSPVEAQGVNSSALQLADSLASAIVLALGGALLSAPLHGNVQAGPTTYLVCFLAAAVIALLGAAGASRVVAAASRSG